jgi:hypothetical protein
VAVQILKDGHRVISASSGTFRFSGSQGFVYYHQIQGGMHLANLNICDFVVWTPDETLIVPFTRENNNGGGEWGGI